MIHVFKGDKTIKKGTIEIVRDCGQYIDVGYLGTYQTILDYNTEYSLATDERMIFFCTPSSLSYQKTDNISVKPLQNQRYAAFYYSTARSNNFKIYGLHDQYFKTVDDFYDYMGKHQGIKLPEEYIEKKKNPQPVLTNEEFMKKQFKRAEDIKNNKKKKKKQLQAMN